MKENILTQEDIEKEGFTYLGKIISHENKENLEDITSIELRFQKGCFYLKYNITNQILEIFKFKYDIPYIEFKKMKESNYFGGGNSPYDEENKIIERNSLDSHIKCKSLIDFQNIFKTEKWNHLK